MTKYKIGDILQFYGGIGEYYYIKNVDAYHYHYVRIDDGVDDDRYASNIGATDGNVDAILITSAFRREDENPTETT